MVEEVVTVAPPPAAAHAARLRAEWQKAFPGWAAAFSEGNLLLLVRGDPRAGEFRGRLQFVVSLQQEGRSFALTLPPENDQEAREYQLSFRFFQRIEGTFRVAPDAVVKSMQVRVYESGSSAPRLTRSVNVL